MEPPLLPPTEEWVRGDHSGNQLEDTDLELNNVPLGCVQYFIAGSFKLQKKAYN